MNPTRSFADFDSQLREFIRASSNGLFSVEESDARFNRAALDLFALQYDAVPAYRNYCDSQKSPPQSVSMWNQIPAVPAIAFKEFDLTSLNPGERTLVFHSSGTTNRQPSRHFHSRESVSIYEASLLSWFNQNVFDGLTAPDQPGLIFLTPPPAQAPHSSLVHMFDVVRRECGGSDSFFAGKIDHDGAWEVEMTPVLAALEKSIKANQPVAILGTAFSFVHLLDYAAAHQIRLSLPPGSRVMETGGYKGRSREIPRLELHKLIRHRLGITPGNIICEYGMSELSSQAYARRSHSLESNLVYHFPPWARAQIISPETGIETPVGEIGLIRIFDLANVRSVLAIQTGDLAVRHADGFELLGRSDRVEPRGCSLMSAETNSFAP